jgi:CheY-like chemotaxis protein
LALPKEVDATTRDYLSTARESADLLLSLLNDLLDSAKIEAGKLELEEAPFSLRRTLEQITRVLSVRAQEKGLVFYSRWPDDMPDAVVGDKMRLRQVLLNLAGNAIKFTTRGEVTVNVTVDSLINEEVHLHFAIRDTGIGIPGGEIERIFEPFAQADTTTARRFGGTGLGLSISSNLTSLMGGRVWAQSQLGQGSVFHFTVRLPLAKLPLATDKPLRDVAAAPATALRILLVEDNPANQKVATYILRERGHMVEVASDGQEAVRMFDENDYDAILMDVQMPGMGGFEATQAIRVKENGAKRMPIIAMTASAMKGDREKCLIAEMDAYLSKPIDRNELVALVESLVAESRSCAASQASR